MREIKPGVFLIDVQDPERRVFDSLFPTDRGTTYNSYLVKGEKVALIDTADPSKKDEFARELSKVDRIDYIISNHSEQDHSGLIPFVLEKFPNAKVIATKKGREFLTDLLGLKDENFIEASELDLGGKTLRFIEFPWAHWPETMVTYLVEDGILFSCDVFGSHYAFSDIWYDDEAYEYAKEYYAEIMMPFRTIIANDLKKLDELDIKMICPSHGPLHKDPEKIISMYKDWTSNEAKRETTVLYVSMHNSTKIAVEKLAGYLVGKVNVVDISKGISMLKYLVDADTLVIATPTALGDAHPLMLFASSIISAYRPKIKRVAFVVLYEWGTRADKTLEGIFKNYEIVDTIRIRGKPSDSDFESIKKLAENLNKR